MGFIKKNLLSVIEWTNPTQNVLVYKYEVKDRYEIMKGSQLVVREAQAAIFVTEGQIADVFTAGTWTLDTNNLPIISKLRAWKYGWETPIKSDVYFISLQQFNSNKWGTVNPIMMRDKDFGMIRVLGHGEFTFHVANPTLFMRECFGTMHIYMLNDIVEHLKSIVIAELSDMLGECEIPALDLASNYLELGDTTRDHASARFKRLGLEIDQILIRNFKLPESVEQAMDERTRLGVFGGKMNEYAQYESIQAMRDAAKNQGTGGMFASAGIGLGVGAKMGNVFAEGISGGAKGEAKVKCAKCGAAMDADAKFCPECGTANVGSGKIACPNCGVAISANVKFCPECGKSVKVVCSKCGAEMKAGLKFCPECGTKIK
ncbi:MAG: SPFH domain-containing protein [Clostridia bacterium]